MKLSKKKRLEKAKVKLKAKKLPKGQNITDTSFKARKIILPGQLKTPNDQEIYTKKNLNIQLLIAHLAHYKVPMRREGLSGLKELVISYEDEIFNLHLPKVIDAVTSMILDLESEIRLSAVDILEKILAKATTTQIEPHFHVLQTYMMCAMTHINPPIRRDSLRLLDILLKNCPKLMVEKADDVLPTFLDLISSSKTSADSNRVISVNFDKKLTDLQWRLRVLSRLTKYFSAIVSLSDKMFCKRSSLSTINEKSNNVEWDGKSPLYIGDHVQYEMNVGYLPCIFDHTEIQDDFHSSISIKRENVLKKHVESLMPILFDSWIEVCPRHKNEKVHILPHVAALMLHCILEIILSLWESLESVVSDTSNSNSLIHWFIQKYRKNIVSTFLPGFPYVLEEKAFSPKRIKKKEYVPSEEEKELFENSVPLTSKCVQQNLNLCFLFTCLGIGRDLTIANQITECVQTFVKEWVPKGSLPILEKVLKTIFSSPGNFSSKSEIIVTVIAKFHMTSDQECKLILSSFMCDFFLTPRFSMDFRLQAEMKFKVLDKWVADLPNLLLEPEISIKLIKVLRVLASQNHKVFLANLKKQSKHIIDSLDRIKVTGISNQVAGKKAIIEVLFSVANLEMLENLLIKMKKTSGNDELLSYVKNLCCFHSYLILQ